MCLLPFFVLIIHINYNYIQIKRFFMPDVQSNVGRSYPLGVSHINNGTNFAIHVKNGEKVFLVLFKEGKPFQEIPLYRTGEVWHVSLLNLPNRTSYVYKIVRKNENEIMLLDPYATSVLSHSKWGENNQEYRPQGQVILDPPFDWQGDKSPKIPWKDMIIYEMHVRGFTIDSSSGVKHPGTYLGIIEKIPYLLELGVNVLELLPIHEFNEREGIHTNPITKEKLYNYFGYSPANYFAPMSRYASQNTEAINEFKTMVRELHKNGIEVILDVVFNHTGEGGEPGLTFSFKGLNAPAYYMINQEGHYLNFSGCGNTLNCNNPITYELIISALRYWVTEMHVDGFRFDLASILTRAPDGTPLGHLAPIVEAIGKDPVLADTKLIAEAWDAAGLYQVGAFTPASTRWSEWNGKYRDIVRRFIKGTPGQKNLFATVLSGSQDLYGIGRAPYCSVNFVIAHDGFSLADLVSYNQKHNEANGENNRDGFDHNDSWNCGVEGKTNDKKIISLRERQIRNFHLALMVSQGVPMLAMGDEYGHTREGNNNTWCQDNQLNWFLWNNFEVRPGFYRFYRSLIEFRKKYPLLGRDQFLTEADITWHGLQPEKPEWNQDNRFIAFTMNIPEQGPDLYVAFNALNVPQRVRIPNPRQGTVWNWVVNTSNPPPDDFYDEGTKHPLEMPTIRIGAYSAIMLRALAP